jgi:hypothetical protein
MVHARPQVSRDPLGGVRSWACVKRNLLRIVFGLTLPFAMFWGLGLPFDAGISNAVGWGPFLFLCIVASLLVTFAGTLVRPEWLAVPSEVPIRTLVGGLVCWSMASYAALAVVLGFALWLFAPADEHALLIALWLPLWFALPLGSVVGGRMARRPTRMGPVFVKR